MASAFGERNVIALSSMTNLRPCSIYCSTKPSRGKPCTNGTPVQGNNPCGASRGFAPIVYRQIFGRIAGVHLRVAEEARASRGQ